MVHEVKRVLREQVGNVRIVGPVGAEPRTISYAYGEPRRWNEAPEQIFHLALRCVDWVTTFWV